MKKYTHYPAYDVMNEKDHWDDHTQSIVGSRLIREREYSFFTREEIELLKRLCSHLVADVREDIIQYIIGHMDQTLDAGIGEGQRKAGLPEVKVLMRTGLHAVGEMAKQRYLFRFIELSSEDQKKLIEEMSTAKTASGPEWGGIPPADFFKKLMGLTIEAYCSHPIIWSEMGYGGPAYPRGYIRTQLGQLDPWEAQPDNA
jgi:hypothetical protein